MKKRRYLIVKVVILHLIPFLVSSITRKSYMVQVQVFMNVDFVAKNFLLVVNLRYTSELIQGKDLSSVITVKKVLEDKVTLICMSKDILDRAFINAAVVINGFHKKLNCGNMKRFILGSNRMNVVYVVNVLPERTMSRSI